MRDAGKQWECCCGFFYRPLVPGTIPRKYQQGKAKAAKKMCRECGKVEVKGIKRLCPACRNSRKRASNRQAQQNTAHLSEKPDFGSLALRHLQRNLRRLATTAQLWAFLTLVFLTIGVQGHELNRKHGN
jgi:hypothetical protein